MSAQTGTKRSARFLTSKTELSELIHETLSEPVIKAEEMDREIEAQEKEAFIGYCASSEAEDLDYDPDGSMYGMDFGTRFPEPLSAKEIMDDAAAQELEKRFYEQEFADEFDDLDLELAMEDFTTAAIQASKEDPQAAARIKEMFEHHISPEARAICEQADQNNPTIKNKDRIFFDNVIGDAAEHAMEQSRNEGRFDNPPIKSL